ncbi:o-succinylbenzoate synthase [bacterium HR16]|nr:o-succinylbenzoate synthase [bacterium HR16]
MRHTIGLSDPLTDADIPPEERLDDGLPQSLQQCIRFYRLTHFKIKLCGEAQVDMERLKALARVLREDCPSCRFTLDANEMYPDMETFRAFWESLQTDTDLREFLRALIFVEQPLHRDEALSSRTHEQLHRWQERTPMIIDESDAELHSLQTALECGYDGCSVKSCKGVFKGIANACLAAHLRRQGKRALISGEDLTTVPPVSLQQDMALMANVGIPHVERNGYHYFRGLSMLPEEIQAKLLAEHPDLFARHEQGFIVVKIVGGSLSAESVTKTAYGVN